MERLVPYGMYSCMTEEDLARLLLMSSFESGVVIVNTRKSAFAVAWFLGDNSAGHVYHLVCGYGYLKAIVERCLRTISRRLDRFLRRFRRMISARAFVRAFFVHYNWFRRHRSLDCRPGEVATGVSVPVDPYGVIRLFLARRRFRVFLSDNIYLLCLFFAVWFAGSVTFAMCLFMKHLHPRFLRSAKEKAVESQCGPLKRF